MPKTVLVLPVFILLIFISVAADAAKYYKWQDEQGRTHYSAISPDGKRSEEINIRTNSQNSSKNAKTNEASNKTAPITKQEPATTAPEAMPLTETQLAQVREQEKKSCEVARKNLKTLAAHARVRVSDEGTGELRFLSPDEHAERKEKSQKAIKEYCK